MSRALSYWEATGSSRFSSIDELPATVDVLVVGGGFTGHWLAYFLTKRRQQRPSVLVAERDRIGYGASTRNAGFLSSGNVSEWLLEWREQGEAATLHNYTARRSGAQILLRELGDSISAVRCGSADLDPPTDAGSRLVVAFNDLVTADGSPSPFGRRVLDIGGRAQEVWFNADDYAIDPLDVLAQLHGRTVDQGVAFSYRSEVVEIGDGRAEIATAAGRQEVRYRHAFVCTNGFIRKLHPDSTVAPARGQILVTGPCDAPTADVLGFLDEGHDYFRFADGRLLVGGGRHRFGADEQTDELATTTAVQDYLENLARRLAGEPSTIEIEYRWAGIMGLPHGVHGSVRALETPTPIDARTDAVAGLGGWGVTLAPYLGELLAQRIH